MKSKIKLIEKKLVEQIQKCVYYNYLDYYRKIDEFDKSISYYIKFSIPPSDLKMLLSFCNENGLMIEFCYRKIIISGFEYIK